MDSNVSNNTNSHKFFKILFDQENSSISIRNLLKQWLLLICDLSQQQFDVQIEPDFITTILETKITLSDLPSKQLSLRNKLKQPLFKTLWLPFQYSCPLGLAIASYRKISLKVVLDNLEKLLVCQQNNLATSLQPSIQVELVSSGWLNFYLDAETIDNWLKRSQFLIQTKRIDNHFLSNTTLINPIEKTATDLFPSQYIHGRCCSLLRLGAREKLITLQGDFEQIGWQLKDPISIQWLDPEHNLWLTEASASNLLGQLLRVTDAFASNTNYRDWRKIVWALSQQTAIFQAECPFLGTITQQYPQKAIARLGLIALVQYWLQRILMEKLHIIAPTEV